MEREEMSSGMRIPLLDEVERRLKEIFEQRKEEIERELEERIRKEREEAERKIRDIEQEIEKGRELLTDYHQVLADFEAERARLQNEIKKRFSRVIEHQSEIERLATLTLEEIKQVDQLNQELESLEKKSGDKIALIRQQIEEKYGIVAETPEIPARGELRVDLEQELERLRKIKELLATEVARMSEESQKKTEADVWPQVEAPAEGRVEPGEPEKPGFQEPPQEETPGEVGPPEGSGPVFPEEASSAEPSAEEVVETFRQVYEKLEAYRKVHSEGNGEIPYFEKEGVMVIDVENLITAMNEALDASRRLFAKLAQSDSPKDHFFIKQEIINQQELLRKHLLRVSKLCEKEGFRLPDYTQSIFNVNLIRDLLERLTIENWSDEIDFQAVSEFIEELKEKFYRSITPPVTYLKSILQELDAF